MSKTSICESSCEDYVSFCTSNPGISCLPFKRHLPLGDWGESSTFPRGGVPSFHTDLYRGVLGCQSALIPHDTLYHTFLKA